MAESSLPLPTEPRPDPFSVLDEMNGDGEAPVDASADLPHLLQHIQTSQLPLELSGPSDDNGN